MFDWDGVRLERPKKLPCVQQAFQGPQHGGQPLSLAARELAVFDLEGSRGFHPVAPPG